MKSKTYLKTLVGCCVGCIGIVVAMTVIVDPYVRFHLPNPAFSYMFEHENTRLFAAGYAKHADYQAVLLGTSHSMNFDPLQIEDLFGVKAWKLPLQGGSVHEFRLLLDIAYENQKQINYVFCNIELERQYNTVTWDYISPYNPSYIYDFDYLSQMEYIFNGDTFRNRVIPMWKQFLSGQEGYVPSKSSFGYTQQTFTMGPTEVLQGFSGADKKVEETFVNGMTETEEANIREIIQRNYSELIEAHPKTQFYFYIPPYSMPWWGNSIINGDVDYYHQVERIYIEELLKYNNVKCFDFNDCYDMMSDLNNYGDITHYGEWVNEYMMDAMYQGVHQITLENCDTIMEDERQYYMNYDYSNLYNQEDLPDPEPRYSGQ